jgi:hypothetical protein
VDLKERNLLKKLTWSSLLSHNLFYLFELFFKKHQDKKCAMEGLYESLGVGIKQVPIP